MILNLLLLSQLDITGNSQLAFRDTATFVQRQPCGGCVRLLPHRNRCCKNAVNRGGRSLGTDVLILFAAMALLLSRATAAVHPVPLEQNVDAKKCLECHEDKSKGKAVHSAIAMGCLSCHDPHVAKAKYLLVADNVDVLAHSIRDLPVDQELISSMKAKGTWYIPTLSVDQSFFYFADNANWSQNQFLSAALSPEVKVIFSDPDYKTKTDANPIVAKCRAALAQGMKNYKTLMYQTAFRTH